MRKDGLATVTYTEQVDSIISYLGQTDILYLATNQDIKDPAIRIAIMKFVNTGHGLILGHPALWYNWLDWPSYNSHLVGGGAKSHDRYGAFDETVVNAKHPVTQGLEPKFSLKDERYHYIHDDRYGPKIETLISSSAAGSDKVYPSVFVVKLPMVRIVAIGLGHDAGSHSTTYYQTLLRNSVKWVAGK